MNTCLITLGSRAGEPGSWGATAGYLVDCAPASILLDCGFGVPGILFSRNLLPALSTVVISHLHTDHIAGLLDLAYMILLREELGGKPLPVLLPPGGIEFVDQWQRLFAMESFPRLRSPFADAFQLQEYEQGSFTANGIHLQLQILKHAIPNYGMRLEGAGWSLTYSGDTGWCPALVRLAEGSSLFLCEATYRSETASILQGHGHLTGAMAGTIAREAAARRLVLTHFSKDSPEWLAALKQDAADNFRAPVDLALPGVEFALPGTAPEGQKTRLITHRLPPRINKSPREILRGQ